MMQFFKAKKLKDRPRNSIPLLSVLNKRGMFRINNPIIDALGVQVGDYILLATNELMIDEAINNKLDILEQFCAAHELVLGTPEGNAFVHNEFDAWGIATGIRELNPKGTQKLVKKSLSLEDKLIFVDKNYDAVYAVLIAQGDDELKAKLQSNSLSRDEMIQLMAESITRSYDAPKFMGSSLIQTGTGTGLIFCDTNAWTKLSDPNCLNKKYYVNLDNPQIMYVNNGHKIVSATVYMLADCE